MSKKIRVLHILHELHPSGAEMMLYNAYPYWKERFDGTIMATGNCVGPFADTLQKIGYEICYVPTHGAGKIAKMRHLIEFYQYMKKHRYDVVHIHRESLSFEYALLAKMTGNYHIVRTVHSTFLHAGLQQHIKSVSRRLMKYWLGVKFIAISDGVAANEKKVFGNTCEEVIYNWCNNKKFAFVSAEEKLAAKRSITEADKLVLVTVGNCGPVKNHTLLLEAMAKCQRRDRMLYLHVGYAQGKTKEEERLAERLGLGDQVRFMGSTDPMPALRQGDVFVMPSTYEGLSVATLEAMFTGMPVLLADAPGLTEFKDKGLVGVDYFTSNPERLAERLDAYVQLFDNGQLAPKMQLRERAKELYDCERQAGRYASVYQKLGKRK